MKTENIPYTALFNISFKRTLIYDYESDETYLSSTYVKSQRFVQQYGKSSH